LSKWDRQIELAKTEINTSRKKKHMPELQEYLKVEHEHGFILMDLDGFRTLSKTQQSKILKLGGH
jgi:transcriptional antiterminator Rof (Rho-off)